MIKLICTTHLIAFQEMDDNSVPVAGSVTIEKSRKRQFNFATNERKMQNPIINKKLTPSYCQMAM